MSVRKHGTFESQRRTGGGEKKKSFGMVVDGAKYARETLKRIYIIA